MSLVSLILISRKIYGPSTYMLVFLMYMLSFKLVFRDSIEAIFSLIIYQIFQMILYRDIFIGILSILTGKSMYQTIKCHGTYALSLILCELLMLFVFINFSKKYKLDMAKKLFINRNNLMISKLTIIVLFIMLINSNSIYVYTEDIPKIVYSILINRVCTAFYLYFSIKMGIKAIKWEEEELLYKTNLLRLEHNNDINKKVDDYSKLLKMYNHDVKNILFNIKDAIEMGNEEKAKEIISAFNEKTHDFANLNNELSNNSLLNALLNRLNENCKTKNICFSSECYIPDEISISELDLLKIFNNLVSNAWEACNNQKLDEKKWINFRSYVNCNELIIYQSNSFNGTIKFKNDKLITTKDNKKIHGIGVESIKHIVNGVNGMAFEKVDKEKREFKFLIKIPLST